MVMFPIPVPDGAPGWLPLVFAAMAVTGFAVLLWQGVRFLRTRRGDDQPPPDDPEPP